MLKLNKKYGFERCWALVVLMLIAILVCVGPAAARETPFSLDAAYSKQDQLQVAANYRLSERFGFELGYQALSPWLSGNEWQGKLEVTPLTGLDLSLGYDFTGKHLLLGANAGFPFKENLKLVSTLNLISATEAERKYLDYLCGMRIGIGYNHTILAGAKGLYEFGTPHEPELFLQLDLNWQLPKGFALSYKPTIGVEGEFAQRMTVSKQWDAVKVGIFAGHKDNFQWDFGLAVSY